MSLVAALATVLLSYAQGPVILTRLLPAKTTETYKVEYSTEATQGDAVQTTTVRWTQEFAFDEPDADSSRIPVTINVKGRTFDTDVSNIDAPPSADTIKGWKLSSDNRLQSASIANPTKKERLPLFDLPAVYLSFPKTAVKPGDSWEMPTSLTSQYGEKIPPLKDTFVGEKEVEGKKYWHLKIDEAMKYSHGYIDAPDSNSFGTAKLLIDALIDQESGRQEITDIKYEGHNIYQTGSAQYESDFKYKVRMVFVKEPKV